MQILAISLKTLPWTNTIKQIWSGLGYYWNAMIMFHHKVRGDTFHDRFVISLTLASSPFSPFRKPLDWRLLEMGLIVFVSPYAHFRTLKRFLGYWTINTLPILTGFFFRTTCNLNTGCFSNGQRLSLVAKPLWLSKNKMIFVRGKYNFLLNYFLFVGVTFKLWRRSWKLH